MEGLPARLTRRLRLLRERYLYEVRRPRLSAADVDRRLEPSAGVDVRAEGGFGRLLSRYIDSSPRGPAWPADEDEDWDPSDDIDWHLEPKYGVRWPRRFEGAIPDRWPGSDMVVLWHKNKMMFLLDLAGRYEATSDARFAEACYGALNSWCRQNPYMIGKNWRSPMEAGTRLVVWSQVLSKLKGSPPPPEPVCARLVDAIVRQAEFLAGNFAEKPVPNNHLIGEAATLYAFAAYWPILSDSTEWMERAERVIVREVGRQVLADGFDYENSVNYHLYVVDFLLLYLHAKVLRGEKPPPPVLEATGRMLDAALMLVSPSGRFPQIGDDSMEDFLALRPLDAVESEHLGGVVRASQLTRAGYDTLLRTTPWGVELMDRSVPLETRHYFEEAGVAVSRSECGHATFVVGPQHDKTFSNGHLHLDGGSFELEVGGDVLFLDSGTHAYMYDHAARLHFRGAAAHNTVVVDDHEPVESDRTFGWDEVHAGRTLGFHRLDDGMLISCERQLPGAGGSLFMHRRHFLDACGVWVLIDAVAPLGGAGVGGEGHVASALFHTPLEGAAVTVADSRKVALLTGTREVFVDVYSTGGHDVEVIDDPADKRCWYSRRYGDLSHGATLRTSADVGTGCRLLHVVRRADTSVRFEGWGDGTLALTVMTDHGARRIELDPEGAISPILT
jgi:hypothetical protein